MSLKRKLKLGHYYEPQYGNYCGSRRRCESHDIEKATGDCPVPEDPLDEVCAKHDYDDNRKDPFADFKMVGRLYRVNPFGHFDRPVYGRLYNYLGAPVAIGLRGLFTAPWRLGKKIFD